MIKFEPKIIIGSLFGIIITGISLINIFFPSLFNMEHEDIQSISIELSENYDQLFKFLKDNQDKYIYIQLYYTENDRYILSIENNKFIKNKFSYIIGTSGKNNLGVIDNNSHTFSFFTSSDNFNIFHRQWGNFCFIFKEDDFYQPFILSIPYLLKGDINYKWEKVKDNRNMLLSGLFFVNKFNNIYEYNRNIDLSYSIDFIKNDCKFNKCLDTIVCELEPSNGEPLVNKYK